MFSAEVLFKEHSPTQFENLALQIFKYQSQENAIYQEFIKYLGVNPANVDSLHKIPFLPISFFKDFEIISSRKKIEKTFSSSGTTGMIPSLHPIVDLSLYHQQLEQSFAQFYGDFSDYIIFPLLPSYAERQGSSLIEMVDFWMQKTGQLNKDYYLYDHEKLAQDLKLAILTNKKIILIGVSFALLDFAEKFPINLQNVNIIETGGMKGRKEEITRNELHEQLKKAFKTDQIQSEYGMTELLSQAYALADGKFSTPNWMKVLIRDTEDPFSYLKPGKTGGINVIDFANINSCSFIATDDLGKIVADNQFEILGRFDNSDIRGCNLLAIS